MSEEKKDKEAEGKEIDTGGGAYIAGGVQISGGDFVGRDKIVQGDEVHGDVYSGDFRGAILNVRSTLKGVAQSIENVTGADPSTKRELEALVAQLAAALEQVPPERDDDAEAVATLTESMVEQATAAKPNKTILQITGEGLKKAAENIADVLPTVLGIVTKIVATVGGLGL
jgi:methyl-accepting chemotaxis protein